MRDIETTAEVLRESLQAILQGAHVSGPGLVKASSGGRVDVQPMLNEVEPDGTEHPYSVIPSVPLMIYGAGGCKVEVTPAVGDIVWLIWADRGLDEWKDRKQVLSPGTKRSHALSDAVAFPTSFGTGAGGTIKITNGVSTIEVDGLTVNISGNVEVTGLVRGATLTPATAVGLSTHTHTVTGGTTSPPTAGT